MIPSNWSLPFIVPSNISSEFYRNYSHPINLSAEKPFEETTGKLKFGIDAILKSGWINIKKKSIIFLNFLLK